MSEKKKYLDTSKSVEERVEDLLSRMTVEEKVSQLRFDSPPIPRLGIRGYNWWSEALHGVARAGRATVFPQAIGMAATFNENLIRETASAISDEARAKYHETLKQGRDSVQYGGLTFWSPNVNIFRDPRWGRGQETWGEDPVLTARMGTAFVRGLQGDDPKYLKTGACAKHYAVHSGPEGQRHSFDACCSKKDLFETYLPAFKALVDAGVESVMGAYNRTNGEPCCGSRTLLLDILREKWGFDGHVVSDCWAVQDFHLNHKITSTPAESAAMALKNGCDLNCGGAFEYLLQSIDRGLCSEEDVDRALERLLNTKFRLGIFDPDQEVRYASLPPEVIDSEKHRALARRVAEESIVLLKNDRGLLPISGEMRKIYLVGPNAGTIEVLLGNYYGTNSRLVTIAEGITARAGDEHPIQYREGILLDRRNPNPVDWSTHEAGINDVVIAVMGLHPSLEGEEGDAIASALKGDRQDIGLPGEQEEFLRKLKDKGTPIVLVLTGGSHISVPEDIADAIVYTWYPGEEGGNALARVLFGDVSPSGRLPFTVPYTVEDLPPYEDYSMKGRTYRYMMKKPLFPFGFGLSYSSFSYDGIRLSAERIKAGESVRVFAKVANRGARDADEIVQLYLSDLEASVDVPVCALKDFRKIRISTGQSVELEFEIVPDMMELVNEEGESVLEPGRFKVYVGGAAPLERSVELGAAQPVSAEFKVH